jgi:glycosyltransferase 2 family protein
MKKKINIIISTVITIILLYFLLSQIKINDVIQIFQNSNFYYLALGFFFYILMGIVRTFRFKLLLKNKLSFFDILPITYVHSLLNSILPVRTGEFSYVYMLKKNNKQSVSRGLSSLIIARVFDFIILISIMILFVVISKDLPNKEIFDGLIPYLVMLLVLIILGLFSLIFLHDFSLNIAKKITKFLPLIFADPLHKFIKSFKMYKSVSTLLITLVYALLIYFCGMIANYYFVIAIGYYLPLNILIIASTFSILSTVLPINGLGSFGTMEGVWVLILGYFAYSVNDSVLLSLSLHIILLLSSSVLGLVSWIKLKQKEIK